MQGTQRKIRADHVICAVMLFSMAAIAFVNVLSRYIFHFSLASTEELTINLFVWMTVVGTGLAFERGGQIGIITLYNIFPGRVKRSIIFFSALLSAALFVVVNLFLVQAIYYELTLFNAVSAALGVPVWIYYAGVPALSVFVFAGIWRDACAKLSALSDEGGTE